MKFDSLLFFDLFSPLFPIKPIKNKFNPPKLKTFILHANSFIKFKQKKIFIYLNYYYDFNNNPKNKAYYLNYRLNEATKNISNMLGIKVVLIKFNFYYYISACNRLLTPRKVIFSQINEKLKYFKFREFQFFNFFRQVYKDMVTNPEIKKFSNNRYFFRIFNVFFSSFLSNNIE